MENVDAQLSLHRALQQRRKKVLAEISLVGIDLEAARLAFESAESRLTSVRTRDLELLQEVQRVTLDLWRLEWKLGRSLDAEDRSMPADERPALKPSGYDQTIVLYDYHGDFPPGTVGSFFMLEGKEIGRDAMFTPKPDGRYMVIDRETGEDNHHRVLTLHLARIR